jgi:phosphatidylglycerol:prolipoprotein diacylglycerol transferase
MGNTVSFPKLGWNINVPKVAFSIGDFSIAWYGIILSVAMAVAIIYAFKHSDRFNLDNEKMLDAVIGGIIGAVIGARLYYVIMKHEDYKSFKDVINIREGGLAVYGGIIGALIVAYIICRMKKMAFLPLFDLAGICLCIGQAIGRWGNFFNQEAFGTNTKAPWGLTSKDIETYILSIAPDGVMSNGDKL